MPRKQITLIFFFVFSYVFSLDVVDAFGIIAPEEPITKGDNVELICAASIYNYTDQLIWKNQIGQIINDTRNYFE